MTGQRGGQVAKGARGEEGVAHIANGPFNAALLIAPCYRHRSRLEPVVCGESEQGRMEADRIAMAFQHSALEIVVQEDARQRIPDLECAHVATQEVLHAGVKEEAQVNRARVRQHHNEGHQRPARPANLQMAEVAPVHLALFARQRAQVEEGLGGRAWPVQRYLVTELALRTLVAAFTQHRVQAAGRQRRKLLKRLQDER